MNRLLNWSRSLPLVRYNRMATAKIKPNSKESDFNAFGKKVDINDLTPSILYLDSDYCVINKPADVRMTGDFPVTVEKLLLRWLPGIEVKSLKWIHQLDFATSGVLCIGLNRKAAAIASSSFELRDVKKQYLAVLQGHVNINDYPLLQQKPLTFAPLEPSVFESDPTALHKRKIADTEITTVQPAADRESAGVIPPAPSAAPVGATVAASTTWQTEVMEANLQLHYQALTDWKATHRDTSIGNPESNSTQTVETFNDFSAALPQKWALLQKIVNFGYEDFQRDPKRRKALRKFLKSCGIEPETQQSSHTSCIELITEQERIKEEVADNTETSFEVTAKTISALSTLYKNPTSHPRIYRLSTAVAVDGSSSGCTEKLMIHVPVSEIPGDFRMEPGHLGNPGKDCETELEILEYGTYKGMEVTKVRLFPRTGRRHQLRIHCLSLGHPIVGDYTYNPTQRDAVSLDKNGEPSASADRMMLHAYRLRVAYPSAGKQKLAGPNENPAVSAIVQTFLTTPVAIHTARNHRWAVNWTGDLSVHTCVDASGSVGVTSVLSDVTDGVVRDSKKDVLVAAEAPDPFVFIDSELQL